VHALHVTIGGDQIEMSLLFLAPDLDARSWVKHLHRQDPGLDLRIWPDVGPPEEILFVLSWKHPLGALKQFPRLKCIASLGFGVDHIFRDPDLPAGVPVTRIVDAGMVAAMSAYVLTAVFNCIRQFDHYRQDQARKAWAPRTPKHPEDVRVGIMGLGNLGSDAARKLCSLGFQVFGWSRTPKSIEGVSSFSGEEGLENFLSRSDVLICLLPLTPATQGILNRQTLSKLPAGAYLINVARGEHLVEEDLLAAFEEGHVSGACLDVFRREPLPESHPFWRHPQVTVTPHVASLTYPKDVAPQIIANYHRVRAGQPPQQVVDLKRGY
jgi:glyoxylate/hydroxypyruvate reductase A